MDSDAVEFIDKYITYVTPDETEYPEMSNLVKKVQIHYHRTTWAPSCKTRIVCSEEKIIEKVLSCNVIISDLSDKRSLY